MNQTIFSLISLKRTNDALYSPDELRRQVKVTKYVCLHIAGLSAVMVGLSRMAVVIAKAEYHIDDLLALTSLAFTITCGTAFWAYQTTNRRRTLFMGYLAESFFAIGLGLMVSAALLIAYAALRR